ncbi:MAG: sugar phosphate isomerase/epimerase [Verrucomicrobia bacterium]|nr:sugar phosphate isomerase/epimerase [Verrucomicrobiota bacterium]
MKHAFNLIASGLGILAGLIITAAPATAQVGTGRSFKGPVGLQLYSLRAEFTRNVPAAIQMVKNLGVKNVELAGTYNLSPAKFKAMLDEAGLKPVSGHFPYDRYKTDPEGIANDAKTLGLEYAGCAWISHQGEFDKAECRDAIQVFNRAGEVLRKKGIKFFYHCHGYEFRPYKDRTFMDLLMEETDPKNVRYQMDVLWVVHPGFDPVVYLKKYGKRWELMHLKDLRKGVKGDFTGKSNVEDDVVLGQGQMDWASILKAAKEVGVKHYFIEDEATAAAKQIPQSIKYLESLRW